MNKANIKLKTILIERNITQRQLAWAIGVDEGLVSKVVRYSMDTAEIRERIADYLELNQEKIFEERG